MFRGDPAHTGILATREVDALGGLKWKFQTGGAVRSSPAVVGDLVYVGSSDGRLYALERDSGKERWSFDAAAPIGSSPAVYAGAVFFASRDNVVYAVDRLSGDFIWWAVMGEDLPFEWGREGWDYYTSSPVVVDSTLLIGSGDGHVYALDVETGAERWRFATEGRIRSSPAVADGVVYVGSADGNLYALELETGELEWRFETEGSALASADFGFDRKTIQSSPAVAGGTVYFGSRDGAMYAVDAGNGELRWRVSEGPSWMVSSPAVSDGAVYAGWSDALIFHAVDASTGEELWRFDVGDRVFSSPTVVGATVYVGTLSGQLLAIDKNTGQERWRYGLGEWIASSPTVADGVVYFGSDDGAVYALYEAEGAAPQPAVFWDADSMSLALYGSVEDHAKVLRYFERAGYRVLDSQALADFMLTRLADQTPSVIVFAMDFIPSSVAPEASDTVLFRRYLDGGGKIVWLGYPPLFLLRDPATRQITGVDWERPGRLLGVDHLRANTDFYSVRLTPAGERWGLTDWWISGSGVDTAQVTTTLALDEDGGAAAWVRSYGGPTGSGFVRLWYALDDDELDAVRAVAEYGIMRRERAQIRERE
jgi:outer membrane protein assembly factor BamB